MLTRNMDGRADGRTGRRTDGQTDGQTDEQTDGVSPIHCLRFIWRTTYQCVVDLPLSFWYISRPQPCILGDVVEKNKSAVYL